jgi:hypothetical protein
MANETTSELTPDQMAARIAELEARIAKGGTLRFKVSEKGAVSVYGLGKFSGYSLRGAMGRLLSIPTNCASSSKPTERDSRSRTKSRILTAFSDAQRQSHSLQVVLCIRIY